MGVARDADGRRLALRTLLIAVGSIGLIITGLLGMHVFSADAPGHRSPSAHVVLQGGSAASPAVSETSAAGEAVAAHHEMISAPTATGAPGHVDIATACILALLLSFSLLLPRPGGLLRGVLSRAWQGSVTRARTKVPASAPPLLLHSISRT